MWAERAACIGYPDQWWVTAGWHASRAHKADNRAAVQVCGGCPVKAQCLAEGLELGDTGVIRGGVMLGRRTAAGDPVEQTPCRRCGELFVPYPRSQKHCSSICATRAAYERKVARA